MRYWEKRRQQDTEKAYKDAKKLMEEMEALYDQALQEIFGMEKRIRQRFQIAYQLDREKADQLLSEPAGREEYLALLDEIQRLGRKNPKREELLAKAAAPSYAFRESVQQAMEDELDAVSAWLAEEEEQRVSGHLIKTAQEQNLRTGFRIQQQAGVGFQLHGISGELAQQMIHAPWSGMDFSSRIWMNQEALGELLNTTLREALMLGISGEHTAQKIAEAMTVPLHRARTLVRTETTYVCNQADLTAYQEAEIEAYRYDATLDMRTSKLCRSLDGKTFRVEEAMPGINYPPMHPNCRSGTVPAFSREDLERMQRRARDPVTGKTVKVPASMTYEEWLNLQKETYGEERIRAAQKMADHRAADRKQFVQYQNLLGKKHLTPSLEKFQLMKYTEGEEWARLKRAFKTMSEVEEKPWKEAFKEKARDIFWIAYAEDVEISCHGISRYFDPNRNIFQSYGIEKVIEIAKKPINYVQTDNGRFVRFYDGLALVFNPESNEIVTMVVRKNVSEKWRVWGEKDE